MTAVSAVTEDGGVALGVSYPLADPFRMCMFTEVFSQTFAQRSATHRPHGHREVFTAILLFVHQHEHEIRTMHFRQ